MVELLHRTLISLALPSTCLASAGTFGMQQDFKARKTQDEGLERRGYDEHDKSRTKAAVDRVARPLNFFPRASDSVAGCGEHDGERSTIVRASFEA